MSKKKRAAPKPKAPPEFPKVIETFFKPTEWSLRRFEHSEPSCMNGQVSIKRYRLTVEEIEEPIEVLHERLRKLWRQETNPHRWGPIKSEAKRLGLDLDDSEMGVDAPPREHY